ncbi:MAG: NAD(P)H-dependent oxidoreductase subunit E, partial [Kiritimatiellae bacterium]|nr:NAD(P)H-dependent oxidoreductase subunit E [Kiritimatiellia bacterium]
MSWEHIDAALDRHGHGREALVAVIQSMQEAYHYLPVEGLVYLASKTGVSEAEITGVATFYNQFRLRPAGRRCIKVCVGTACHVKGAERTYEAFRRELKIADGQDTDPDGEFTVEKVACLGCCMLAVAVQVDQTIYGQVTPARVKAVLQDVRSEEASDVEAGETAGAGVGALVRICTCSSCAAAGAADVMKEIRRVRTACRLPVAVREVGCTGGSYHAPLMEVTLEDGRRFRYGRIRIRDVEPILLRHVAPGHFAVKVQAALRAFAERMFAGEGDETPIRFPASVRDQAD